MYDYHLHSNRSADGYDSVEDIVASAKAAGFDGICLTDHWEAEPESSAWRADYSAVERFGGYLRLGAELGTPHADVSAAKRLVEASGFDFVMASIHYLPGQQDFYYLANVTERESKRLMAAYVRSHLDMLRDFGDFDVVGHIGYPVRYNRFYRLDTADCLDALAELFRTLAADGKGIEVNTSGLRYGNTILPESKLLRLYRECGGEIVTVGSDAHRAADVGSGLSDGMDALRAAGFEFYTVYENRKPRQIKL